MTIPAASPDFTEEQKNYLQGFASGIEARRMAQGLPSLATAGKAGAAAEPAQAGPDKIHRDAQDRTIAAGGKLAAEEQAKRAKNPLDMWDEIQANAASGRFPKGTDVFLTKFHGLFYVAPAQNAYMCRLRMPGGILTAHQFRGVADLAERLGGGYADVTTRANLQIREIAAGNAPAMLTGLQDLGLTSRGSGADNIRNVTGSPTAGIDPQELIDTRPLAHALHHHILNHREFFGLPRKFNIAFDGGGRIAVLEDTNDIGFAAIELGDGVGVEPGVYFRLQLGGITGHGDFARETGVIVPPGDCIAVAAAVVRVFIDHGDRTDRKKARLKYLLDRWGVEKFLAETQKLLPFKLKRVAPETIKPRAPADKHGHIGIHPQKQAGLFYVGAVLPVGRMTVAQMRGLADLARDLGGGTIRLTVWQNLLISDIPEAGLADAKARLRVLGLDWSATSVRGGLVACTGNTGCKFSATDTKGQAMLLAEHLESRVSLDQPVNIHLTGCHHSCAQHYVGDIGLLGAKVERSEETVEGYHIYVGGGAGDGRKLGRELWTGVPFGDVPRRVETLLRAYLANRRSAGESFHAFANRHEIADLRGMCGEALP
jgi:ferredoxin-nitrite reductase